MTREEVTKKVEELAAKAGVEVVGPMLEAAFRFADYRGWEWGDIFADGLKKIVGEKMKVEAPALTPVEPVLPVLLEATRPPKKLAPKKKAPQKKARR